MSELTAADLNRVSTFPQLVELLRDHLAWPIEEEDFDDVVFEYDADELGLKDEEAAKVREVHQLRPLTTDQPWGVFFISMEEKAIPVTVLRRILKALVVKKRAGTQFAERRAWDMSDLIFATSFGKSGARELAFIHFSDGASTGDLPVMKVLGWNARDTFLHNDYVAGMLREKLVWPDDTDEVDEWRKNWSCAFELRMNEVISTSKDLAMRLADLASDIRARAKELLSAEVESGPMRTMLAAFRKNLIHDLDEDGFADMFAQTIAYGLLAARVSRPGADIVADNLADMVPPTNPFLKELFGNFLKIGGRDKRAGLDFDELGIRDVVDVLNNANMEAVLRDFGDQNPKEDPVIHFYELFLKEYDPEKRMQRGVFYTPRPVVNFIVRGVDEILRTEFGLLLGLADTSTWAEVAARHADITIPDHVQPDAPFVQILDPATGTGTFLVEVIDLIHGRMVERWRNEGLSEDAINEEWNAYVPQHLLPRLTAFELMMAPYAIAHMKVGLKLSETGYAFGSEERARIFLTNALDPARDLDSEFNFVAEALAHEAFAANRSKLEDPFTVVLGNPPYSEKSENKSTFITDLMEDYKKTIRDEEAQIKTVSNDYVKFIRLASYQVERLRIGIIGLITANGYMDGTLFRDMRRHLVSHLNQVELTNLHGSGRRGDAAQGDENVFDIIQGVSILIAARTPRPEVTINHADVLGSREAKSEALISAMVKHEPLPVPSAGAVFFVPRSESRTNETTFTVNEIFGTGDIRADRNKRFAGGFKTRQDRFTVALEEEDLLQRIRELADKENSEAAMRKKYRLCTTAHFEFDNARREASSGNLNESIRRVHYRPFDARPMIWNRSVLCEPQTAITDHLTGENLCLTVSRIVKDDAFRHVMVVSGPAEVISLSNSTSTNAYMFPLYLYIDNMGKSDKHPNLNPRFLKEISTHTGKRLSNNSVAGNDSDQFSAEDVFGWVYAILHSPSYRLRYAQELFEEFAKIPLPKDDTVFGEVANLGRELVAVHLLRPDEAPIIENPDIRFAGTGEARVAKGYPRYENGKVKINDSRWFEDVPKPTWQFMVGGYKVCEKWLKDRAGKGGENPHPGRVLTDEDILHYRRVVVALTETQRLMTEIDKVIDQHGGWPDAFYQPPPPPPTIEDIIQADESHELEFKSTFQWDMRQGKQNKDLQREVLKTLAAFMNTDGGTLAIGVTDEKEIIGLKHDLNLVGDSIDKFENRLMSVAATAMGTPNMAFCKIRFADAPEGRKVCVIEVAPAKSPVFVDFQGKHDFYIRRGNATVSLNGSDQHAFTRQRFPD